MLFSGPPRFMFQASSIPPHRPASIIRSRTYAMLAWRCERLTPATSLSGYRLVAQATTSSPVLGQPPAGGEGGAGDGGAVGALGVRKLWVRDHALDVLASNARTRQKNLVPALSSWLTVNRV